MDATRAHTLYGEAWSRTTTVISFTERPVAPLELRTSVQVAYRSTRYLRLSAPVTSVVGMRDVQGADPHWLTSTRWTMNSDAPDVCVIAAVPSMPRVIVHVPDPAPPVTRTIS